MINFEEVTGKTIKEHNENWHQIPDHLNKILIISSSGSGKRDILLNLMSRQSDIDKLDLNK